MREQTTVVGHAVRAVYLLAGVVDVYLETGEEALLDSALRQWSSMTRDEALPDRRDRLPVRGRVLR